MHFVRSPRHGFLACDQIATQPIDFLRQKPVNLCSPNWSAPFCQDWPLIIHGVHPTMILTANQLVATGVPMADGKVDDNNEAMADQPDVRDHSQPW